MSARLCPAILYAVLLAGCSSAPGADPIAWWRQLEGGRLAEERPLPPNADAPYPTLGTVPTRPATTEAALRARIATGLESDRRDAAFAASQPVLPPAARRAAPADSAPSGGIGASLAAASAAPAAPPALAPAQVPAPRPVAAPVAPAPPAQAPASPSGTLPPAAPPLGAPAPAESPPIMPSAPPPPPRLPGVAARTVPVPALRAPAAASTVTPFSPGAPVAITFAPGIAILPDAAAATLRQLAASRGGHDISVAGYGESPGTDAASQSAVLTLAFARARAIAASLAQAGVPMASIRVTAQAAGRGGVARVVE